MAKRVDQFVHLARRDGVETRGGFVEEENCRIVEQRPRERDTLAQTFRQAPARIGSTVRKVDGAQDAIDLGPTSSVPYRPAKNSRFSLTVRRMYSPGVSGMIEIRRRTEPDAKGHRLDGSPFPEPLRETVNHDGSALVLARRRHDCPRRAGGAARRTGHGIRRSLCSRASRRSSSVRSVSLTGVTSDQCSPTGQC